MKFNHRNPIDDHELLMNHIESAKLNLIKEIYEIIGIEFGSYDEAAIEFHNYLTNTDIIMGEDGVKTFLTFDQYISGNSDNENVWSDIGNYEYNGDLISVDDMLKIFPKAKKDYVAAALTALDKYGEFVGLTNKGKLMVLAQMAVESGRFYYTAELGKGKDRKYGQPTGPYNKVYYGRGPIQITWEGNYKKITQEIFPKMGIDANIWADPDLCERNLLIGCAASVAWFGLPGNGKRAVQCANNGDVDGLSKAINGGWNGIEWRREYTKKIFQYVSA